MKQKVKEREIAEEKVATAACHHFWDIEAANGPSSTGVCRYCGEKREFFNTFPTMIPLRKPGNPFSLPKLNKVEIDKKNHS